MKDTPDRHLSNKFLIGFLLLAVLICSVCSIIGYSKYKSTIQRLYTENCYSISNIALSGLDGDILGSLLVRDENGQLVRERQNEDGTWAVTAEPFQKGDRYQVRDDGGEAYEAMTETLNMIRRSSNAQYILLYVPLDDPETPHLAYLFDAENDYFPQNQLGMTDPMNPIHFDDVLNIYETGQLSDSYFISHSDYGYTTSAVLPVRDSSGNVVCLLDVYVPMTLIEKTLFSYVSTVIITTVVLVFLFIFIFLSYIQRKVLKPLKTITDHTKRFVESEAEGAGLADEQLEICTGDEIEVLANSLTQMEGELRTYIRDLTSVTAEKERIGTELSIATQIQADMLPSIFPAFPECDAFDIYATMTPAKEVGGDFYDFFMVDETHIAIVMADVSGKGVPAALFMAIGKTLIKDHTDSGLELGEVFAEVNNILCASNKEGLFITAFEGVLDLVTGQFSYVNAGHELPFICPAGGEYEPHPLKPGFVLAGLEDIRYQMDSLVLKPGDKLFQYTDGVTEATSADEELFGMERLQAVLNENRNASPRELLPAVKAAIDKFVGDAEQFDDITMLCLEYCESMKPTK